MMKLEITPALAKAIEDFSEAVRAQYVAQGAKVQLVHLAAVMLPTSGGQYAMDANPAVVATTHSSEVLLLSGQLLAEAALGQMVGNVDMEETSNVH